MSSGDFPPTKMDPDQARQRDFYWIQTYGPFVDSGNDQFS